MVRALVLAVSFLASLLLTAGLTLDPVFSSHMVLQQQRPIRFFGTADPGKEVKLEFAGKQVSAKADASGNWQAEFPAMTADRKPLTLCVASGAEKKVCDDVLIGEVWFCSGQSNMEMPIGAKFKRGWSAQNCEEEVRNADYPEIRYAFQIKIKGHQQKLPAQYFPQFGGWVRCTPENAPFFSATSYFFGRKLYQDLKVPIGLINASFGGTPIISWISQEGFRAADLTPELEEYKTYALPPKELKALEKKEKERFFSELNAWHPRFVQIGAEAKVKAAGWAAKDLDDSKWIPLKKVGRMGMVNPEIRWFRTHFALPEAFRGQRDHLTMDHLGNEASVFLNGREIASYASEAPGRAKKIDVMVPADAFDPSGNNVLAIRMEVLYQAGSATPVRNILERVVFTAGDRKLTVTQGWRHKTEFRFPAKQHPEAPVPEPIKLPHLSTNFPSTLYNGMVDSWTRLPVRGVIWYQGCNDNGKIRYYPWHKALINDWRTKWHDPEMPFIITQLAGYEPRHAEDWRTANATKVFGYALTRDIQRQVMQEMPRVGLACLIDVGEADNIHPANKQDVGLRLALEAERIAYGRNIVSQGPLFREAKAEGNSMRVSFDNVADGLTTSDGKAPGAFAIAGADGVFHWAEAKIDGNTVVVSSPDVKEPRFVRYAYAGYRGDCNLRNGAGLPAYPFRSDAVDYSSVR